jgi:hypothetical protein
MKDRIPKDVYIDTIRKLNDQLDQLNKKKAALSWLRLISFLTAVLLLWLLWPKGLLIALAAFVIVFAGFLFFVSKDLANKAAIDNTLLLLRVNKEELSFLEHQFTQFPDGNNLQPELHPYANDLDVFGRASLYQYINRTTSQQGNQLLATWLLTPAVATVITQRQEAVKELTAQHEWRQQLQAYGLSKQLTLKTEENITSWLREENRFTNTLHWKILRFLLPALSITCLVLHLNDIIPQQPFYSLMLLFLAISLGISKKIMPAWTKLGKITAELETLSESIGLIEKHSFESPLLQQLKKTFSPANDQTASSNIRALKKILDRLDYRLNPIVFIPLSIFLCWDLQQIFALEKWKKKNQQQLRDWFVSLAQLEALSTLGNISFNHPEWCFAELATGEAVFTGEEIGHPLIPAGKRINNSFTTTGINKISLITGSNMAGKSTFLRSTGINIVLAMMGAPVCARSLTLSPMKVMSSMRISDNLEESTSTFYAELKKLKEVIEAVNKNEKVFLLLDEILRGTNSADRHAGSKALIKQLIHHKAVGMVATHDLELAKLEKEYPENIHNYHFDVQVANDELFFDYKLKEGVCQSMNASILMKKIGIEL